MRRKLLAADGRRTARENAQMLQIRVVPTDRMAALVALHGLVSSCRARLATCTCQRHLGATPRRQPLTLAPRSGFGII